MIQLTPTTVEIIVAVLVVLFAIYVLFCLGMFGKDK
jgi:hypothetical protein